ncbi:hypothetical protein ACI2LJ_13750 [Streptomyces sp. NPDC088090]|uniref:hypothetical protein n=1 Tax=Streptomyces sp. NPDC088090 TaxID=3365822 RepID=UPI00384D5446
MPRPTDPTTTVTGIDAVTDIGTATGIDTVTDIDTVAGTGTVTGTSTDAGTGPRAVTVSGCSPGVPVLRRVGPGDRRLRGEARPAAPTLSPEAFTRDLADWRAGGEERRQARLDDPTALGPVALLGDRPVGLAGGLVPPDGVPELRSLWVAPGPAAGDRRPGWSRPWRSGPGRTARR